MNEKKSVLDMNDLMEREVYELQKSLQNSFIRQKTLIERLALKRMVVLMNVWNR